MGQDQLTLPPFNAYFSHIPIKSEPAQHPAAVDMQSFPRLPQSPIGPFDPIHHSRNGSRNYHTSSEDDVMMHPEGLSRPRLYGSPPPGGAHETSAQNLPVNNRVQMSESGASIRVPRKSKLVRKRSCASSDYPSPPIDDTDDQRSKKKPHNKKEQDHREKLARWLGALENGLKRHGADFRKAGYKALNTHNRTYHEWPKEAILTFEAGFSGLGSIVPQSQLPAILRSKDEAWWRTFDERTKVFSQTSSNIGKMLYHHPENGELRKAEDYLEDLQTEFYCAMLKDPAYMEMASCVEQHVETLKQRMDVLETELNNAMLERTTDKKVSSRRK